MTSVATDRLSLQCHKFDHMLTPLLLSVKTFCDNNLDVLFKQDKVIVTNGNGNTVFEGTLDPSTDLYMIPLADSTDAILPLQRA